jgi:hypothetical protein
LKKEQERMIDFFATQNGAGSEKMICDEISRFGDEH